MRLRPWAVLALIVALAGCQAAPVEIQAGRPDDARTVVAVPLGSARDATATFRAVVAREKPVAERLCRQHRPMGPCTFSIQLLQDPRLPANAFESVDRNGRPSIAFTVRMLTDARNADELAFVMGHEAAHHILGHHERSSMDALSGAILAGVLASASGAGEAQVEEAQRAGAFLGARQYSKDYELEADALGARIAYLAGYDPIRGAAYFQRIPDPGNKFLGTHPANAKRIAIVRRTVAEMQAGG